MWSGLDCSRMNGWDGVSNKGCFPGKTALNGGLAQIGGGDVSGQAEETGLGNRFTERQAVGICEQENKV